MGLFKRKGWQDTASRHRVEVEPEAHVADGLLDAEVEALIWARRERRNADAVSAS